MAFFSTVKKEIQTLFPAYFALVMATGILSIAAHLLNYTFLSNLLFWVNNFAYGILLILLLIRLVFFFPSFLSDLSSLKKGAGFFTLVAGSAVLGVQYALGKQSYLPASILWLVALAAWVLLAYAFLALAMTKSEKPPVEKGLNGSWLILVVATQSIAILGTTLASHVSLSADVVLFFTLSAFLLGSMLYFLLIALVFYRLTFFSLSASTLKPSYWVMMGAAAISTLAGSTLIEQVKNIPALSDFTPFLKGMSVLFWATGTWWIPLLVILDVWKYVVRKTPLQYSPGYWSTVFTLGMYTVCTFRLAEALQMPFLKSLPRVFIWVTLVAWGLTLLGMCTTLVKLLFASQSVKMPADSPNA